MRFDVLELPQTYMTKLYTPRPICNHVFLGGSMRFDVLELPQTYMTKLYKPCSVLNDVVVRVGSSTSNLIDPPQNA